jgi:ABC-type branched-subunit amino acid transport system substrate-binding protein
MNPVRAGSSMWKGVAIFVAGAVIGVLAAYQVVPASKAGSLGTITTGTAGTGTAGTGTAGTGTAGTGTAGTGTAGTGTAGTTGVIPSGGFQCARGKNGGATDKGVTATSINMATTVVRSGIGAAFLGDVQYAMDAVKNKVNREKGGVCGRLLDIRYVDDGWDPTRGQNDIRDFISKGYFAIPVGPSSEGLNAAIRSGIIHDAGIPVVGTDGMVISQYKESWVWPVAVSTASSARIMADAAKAMGAKSCSIVFDQTYKFGKEAAQAFNKEVKAITGSNVPGYDPQAQSCQQSFCGVVAGKSSYATEIQKFKPGNIVVLFLEPTTALTWMYTPGAPTPKTVKAAGGVGVWGAQPLFTYDFGVNCQDACHQMYVWTGFKPPIENYAQDPAIKTYVSDLRRTKPDADKFNAFAEGGYVGMQLLVAALEKVGPNLTRNSLARVLDAMSFNSSLALQSNLAWHTGNHFSNATMQAFEIQYSGSFSGWRSKTIVRDPNPSTAAGSE